MPDSPHLRRIQNLSFPRSGNSLLTLMLFKYFTRDPHGLPVDGKHPATRYSRIVRAGPMYYCESSGHCHRWPCPDPRTNFQKHHDQRLAHGRLPGYSYLVQYRHPAESLASFYDWTLQNRPGTLPERGDSHANWIAFLGREDSDGAPARLAYWRAFVAKWAIAELGHPRLLLDYAELIDAPRQHLARVIRFMAPDETPDASLIRAVIDNLEVSRQHRIRRFRYFEPELFARLALLAAPEIEALGLADMQ